MCTTSPLVKRQRWHLKHRAHLLPQNAAGWGTDAEVPSQLICKLLRLGQQAGAQELDNEAALLEVAHRGGLEKAEEHVTARIDLDKFTCRVGSSLSVGNSHTGGAEPAAP